MKTLHINTERTWRGGEQQTLNLLCGLYERNITAHLVCQPESPMEKNAKKAGIMVFPVAMHGEADIVAAFKIRKILNSQDYDILHAHTSHGHVLGFLAAAGKKTCVLVTRRVDFSIFRSSFLHLSGIKYRYMADYYIAISHEIKRVMEADGILSSRIFVVHSGIDTKRFAGAKKQPLYAEFNIKEGEPVIVNVAHLAPHKGQAYLVKAIPYVLEKIPSARFFIVGGGELMADLRSLAASLGLKDRLVFTGFRPDVGNFYSLADLFVMSSVQEGLGTAVLDALAMEKPVVATRAGGIPEIIEDGKTGRLVEPENPAALSEGIIDMLLHSERAGQMAAQGRLRVETNFSIRAMVEKNIAVYRRILKSYG
jgi:L-malate glycosyltransferase